MSGRGIIFSAPMVRALLDGRKTQTRQLATSPLRRCVPGDRLWVREAWRTGLAYEDLAPSEMGGEEQVLFEADGATERWSRGSSEPGRLRPGMHMPRWASRLTLIVEEVRVEPLQAITEGDAVAEGILWQEPTDEDRAWAAARAEEDGGDADIEGVWIAPGTDCGFGPKPRQPLWGPTAASCYQFLWNSLHGAGSWDANPAVVALTFRVERANIDSLAERAAA